MDKTWISGVILDVLGHSSLGFARPDPRELGARAEHRAGRDDRSTMAAKTAKTPPKKRGHIAPPEAPKPLTIEERAQRLDQRLQAADPEFQRQYLEALDMSWIYHDSALEGTVYTQEELRMALDPSAVLVAESSLQPICEEIRRHREALEYVRDFALRKRLPVTLDVVKKIYLIFHPEEGDIKTVRYRKDVPQHRLYFHEYAPPEKIPAKVRQVVDWLNDPETRKARGPLRIAARAHYDLLRVFPFATDSGKVARLLLNLLLLRAGYPPSIVHSTERQRYYEALKGSSTAMSQIVLEAVENNLASVEKLLDSYEARRR
ncbi:MAG: Fic family protein [Myxococcales bacterium]|nr:Fic family protein [Myxococcales bacterium]